MTDAKIAKAGPNGEEQVRFINFGAKIYFLAGLNFGHVAWPTKYFSHSDFMFL